MKILNLGSLNIDFVYQMDDFVRPGETKLSEELNLFCGGKGLNQSIAASRAGCEVFHGGLVGVDGGMLIEKLQENGVSTDLIIPSPGRCGNAIIQVNSKGENCIILYGGTNRMLDKSDVDRIFDGFGSEGAVLLQNEVNLLPYIIEQAHTRGLPIFLNAAPMDERVLECPLDKLDWLMINEVEGRQIAGCENDSDIIPILRERYPGLNILLTLGSRGAACLYNGERHSIEACRVPVTDTTAAGDTFNGYFMACLLEGRHIAECLQMATVAASICVGREGAADSVPLRSEVEAFIASGEIDIPNPVMML